MDKPALPTARFVIRLLASLNKATQKKVDEGAQGTVIHRQTRGREGERKSAAVYFQNINF